MENRASRQPIPFLSPNLDSGERPGPFVAIVRHADELRRCLTEPDPCLLWVQVEGLLTDEKTWAFAARDSSRIPIDVVLESPGVHFPYLYELAKVRASREVRVSILAVPGLEDAVRLAASLGLPVRVLPGQPSEDLLEALEKVADFYLRDSATSAPIEPFHSVLAALQTGSPIHLWAILEEDPEDYARVEASRRPILPIPVQDHLVRMINQGRECAACAWLGVCSGYFKWPDPAYACQGVKRILSHLQTASEQIAQDLAVLEQIPGATPAIHHE